MKLSRSAFALLVLVAIGAAVLWWLAPRQRAHIGTEIRHAAEVIMQGGLSQDNAVQVGEGAKNAGDGEAAGEARVSFVNGVPVVHISEELQKKTGIRVEAARTVTRRPEFAAYGEVTDLGPLVQLRSRYGGAQSARDIASAALIASQHELKRLRLLRKNGAGVPAKQIQQAEARYEGDRARLEAAERQLRAVREEASQQWGPLLAEAALQNDSGFFNRLLQRKQVLILVGLPADRSLPAGTTTVYIDRNGDRTRARKALLVSPAPQTDAATQGETWYFRAPAGELRTGMRLDVWVPQPGPGLSGVNIPASAVVWYAGKPWIYVERQPGRFVRRSVARHTELGNKWFVRSGIGNGERVVVTGGQMLLSEEFRWQIPEEDND